MDAFFWEILYKRRQMHLRGEQQDFYKDRKISMKVVHRT